MRTRLALLTAVTAAALAITGCSGSGSPAAPTSSAPTSATATDNGVSALFAADIVTKTVEAVKDAGSVHLTGTVEGSTVDATESGGNIELKTTGSEGNLEARLIGSDLYYKGDAAFFKNAFPAPQADTLAAQRADKWVKTSAAKDPQVSQVINLLTPANILATLTLAITPTKGATTTVNGQPAIEVKFTSSAASGSLFVATTGAPVTLRITLANTSAPIDLTYGTAATIEAPTPDITA